MKWGGREELRHLDLHICILVLLRDDLLRSILLPTLFSLSKTFMATDTSQAATTATNPFKPAGNTPSVGDCSYVGFSSSPSKLGHILNRLGLSWTDWVAGLHSKTCETLTCQ